MSNEPSRRSAPTMSAASCAPRRSRRRARKREKGEITPDAAQGGRGSRDRGAHQEAGSGRAQIDHRRRISPRLLADRFPDRARRRRVLRRRAQVQVPGRAQPQPILLRVNKKLGGYAPHPMIEHFKFVQSHTKATPKMTIPSPSTLHFRYGREAVPESIYPSMDDFYRDLGPVLPQGGARLRRRRLPLSAARRGQPHLSVRSRAAPAGHRARRRSRPAAASSMPT